MTTNFRDIERNNEMNVLLFLKLQNGKAEETTV